MRKNILLAVIALLCLLNTGWLAFKQFRPDKVSVVDVRRIFNEFKLKTDLESRVQVKLSEFSNAMDSVKGLYQVRSSRNASADELKALSRQLDSMGASAQQAYEISNKTINEQVWQRLNILLEEYGSAHNCKLMIGANGMGTVLYNEKKIDETEEVIKFINAKYEKGF